jgi:hypothetical protein
VRVCAAVLLCCCAAVLLCCCAAGAGFDLETCLQSKRNSRAQHRLTRPSAPEPSTAHLWSASAVPARAWSLEMAVTTTAFLYVVTTQTLGESGLDRWAIRLTANSGWSHGFGVSAGVDPAEALRLSTTSGQTGVHGLTQQDPRFVLLSTFEGVVFHKGNACGAASAPPKTVLHSAGGFNAYGGTIVTFQVDRKANALLMQTHRPHWGVHDPKPGTAPTAEDAVEGRVPSQVWHVPLPPDMRWQDLRPTLTLWYVPCHLAISCAFARAIATIRISPADVWSAVCGAVCCTVVLLQGRSQIGRCHHLRGRGIGRLPADRLYSALQQRRRRSNRGLPKALKVLDCL